MMSRTIRWESRSAQPGKDSLLAGSSSSESASVPGLLHQIAGWLVRSAQREF
jgi:hypothetical protein